MKNSVRTAMSLAAILWLSACSEQQQPSSAESMSDTRAVAAPAPASGSVPAGRNQGNAMAMRGAKLYQANCAVCHGANAEGAPNWQRKGPDGKLPPPPLDANGHVWHHPSAWLRDMIKQGSVRRGGNMPSWEGKLTADDIEAVIVWIQSRWPEEIYRNWLVMEEKARKEHAPP